MSYAEESAQTAFLWKQFTQCKKCPCLELFWSVFSLILTEYGIQCISTYSVQMRENTVQNDPKYGHFSTVSMICIDRPKVYEKLIYS